jgi:hypothetical protein
MKIRKLFLLTLVTTLLFIDRSVVKAVTAPTLTLTPTTGDAVQVSAIADPNTSLRLSFLPPGATQVTSLTFGTTDNNGRLVTTISSGAYGIPAGSPAYLSNGGLQSGTTIWPTYASSLQLTPSSVQIGVGQNTVVTASSVITLAANTNTTSIGTSIAGNQLRVTGLTTGNGSLYVCSVNAGCTALIVTVGGQGQSTVSLSQNNVNLSSRQTIELTMFGPQGGFVVSSNSNPTAVTPSISGGSSSLVLYGNDTAGTATIVVCSTTSSSNCATLTATVSGTPAVIPGGLTLSPNSLVLTPAQTQFVTISGGPNNTYYLSGNSNSSVVQATLSGNSLTLVGGTTGTATVSVCSASINATCGTVSVTTNPTTTGSNGLLSFSKNVISLPQGESTTITVSGGTGNGYIVSGNTNPALISVATSGSTAVTLSSNGNSGSSIITICATSPSTLCGSIYVNATAEPVTITFSQNNLVLTPGQTLNLTVSGGNGGSYLVSSNSSPTVASAVISSGNSVLSLKGGGVNGSTIITVCSSTDSATCGSLYVSTSAPVTAPVITPPSTPSAAPATTPVTVYTFKTLLKIGSSGTEVRELQKLLAKLGFFKAASTGTFGSVTQAAVKAFQKKYGIDQVGYVGPATRAKLNSLSLQ